LRNIIQGAEFRATRLLLRERREPAQWTGSLLMSIHREVFGRFFPGLAGRYRTGEANFGARAAPPPEQLDALLQRLLIEIAAHLASVRDETDPTSRMDAAFLFAALDHAEMIRIHPFVDGNGRWARIVTNVFLHDCGFPLGTVVRKANKQRYIAAMDRCIDNREPGDLAAHLLAEYANMLRKSEHGSGSKS
jgi:fido (protein-threonine AMPylation protein)